MDDLISRQAAIDAIIGYFGFNIEEEYGSAVQEVINGLPSAQPEIIRCKDCKHHHYEKDIPYCDRIDYGYGWKDNDYCSRAERREE